MKDMIFEVTNENGEKISCRVLHIFSKNSNNYMIYTDDLLDEDGNIEVLATKYTINNDKLTLEAINTDEEWSLVDEEWSKVYDSY